jgi:hypothetical protein
MTNVSITGGELAIDITGWDKLWSFKSGLKFPLAHVAGARPAANERPGGIRAPGTHVPGLITAGTYHQHGQRVFWNVHHLQRAVVIDLRDEAYAQLILEVADQAATVDLIQNALAGSIR